MFFLHTRFILSIILTTTKNTVFLKLVRECEGTVQNMRSKTLLRDLRAWFHGALDKLGTFLSDFKNKRMNFNCVVDMPFLLGTRRILKSVLTRDKPKPLRATDSSTERKKRSLIK